LTEGDEPLALAICRQLPFACEVIEIETQDLGQLDYQPEARINDTSSLNPREWPTVNTSHVADLLECEPQLKAFVSDLLSKSINGVGFASHV